MEKPRILRTDQTTTFNERGGVEQVYRVTFWIGDDGPFTQDFRPGDYTPATVQARLEAVAATVGKTREIFPDKQP